MLSWVVELNIIMKSIGTSARCLIYVIALVILFLLHFGAAGVYLFSENDPFHFKDLPTAMKTLFQVRVYVAVLINDFV